MADSDLTAIEDWIGGLADRLSARERKKLAMLIGRELRRQNAQRIATNVEPNGNAMAPRIRRVDQRTGRVRKTGKMFPRIRLARNLKVAAGPDGVDVGFATPSLEQTAAVHHFGEVGYVGRTESGRIIRTQYTARRLLGFGRGDREAIADLALAFLAGE